MDTLLKPERLSPGTLAELALKPRRLLLLLWILVVDLLDMLPGDEKAGQGETGCGAEQRGADEGDGLGQRLICGASGLGSGLEGELADWEGPALQTVRSHLDY